LTGKLKSKACFNIDTYTMQETSPLTHIITQLWEAKQKGLVDSVAVYPRYSYTKILILFHQHTPKVIKTNLESLLSTKYQCQIFMTGDSGAVMSIIVNEPFPQHLESLFSIPTPINVNMWYFME